MFEETWKQRACMFRKAEGSPVRGSVSSAVRRTLNEPRHLCFVKLNSHSKVVSVPSVPFYLSCGLHELHNKINSPAKVFWKAKC